MIGNSHKQILGLIVFFLISFPSLFISKAVFSADNKVSIALATGSEKGVYFAVGRGISDAAKRSNIKINVIGSQGSVENLYWLSQAKAQIGFAQSDTVYNAYHGLGRFKEKITNIQTIASLYTEAVHILVRNPLYIKKIEEFKGKRISVGLEGSGTESNAIAILEAAGITPHEIQLLHLSFEDSIRAFNEEKADIAFFTSGYPSDAVKNIMQNNTAYFFEPNPDTLQRLIDVYPFFVITTIPAGAYTHQDEDITTIGVPTLLVGRNDLDSQLVYTLTKSIFSNTSTIADYHNKGNDIKLSSVFKGVSTPIHQGANKFYIENGLYRKEVYKKNLNYVLAALLIALLVITIMKFKQIKIFFKKREFARVIVFLLSIWVFGSITLYYAEHKINENYSGLLLSFWSGLITWINFGSKEPYTLIGRTTTTVMMILGVGGIAWLTGQIASFFVHKKLTGGRRMMSKLEGHYVIVNWNDKGCGIIDQLHSSDFKEKRPIVVVTDFEKSPVPLKHEHEDVFHISDSTINEDLLKKTNIHRAKSVIILAKKYEDVDGNPIRSGDLTKEASDAISLLTILTIRKLCADEKVKQVHIVAEILNPQKVKLADFAGMWGDGSVEIVSSQYMEQNLLAQVAVSPGVAEVYKDLLTFEKETSEIYGMKIPSQFIGKYFKEVLKFILELRDKNINIIPIAMSRKGKVYVNPSDSHVDAIEDGDTLFVICDSEDDIKKVDGC